jgi:hypothetical protein
MKPLKSSSFINAVVLSAAILGFSDIACAKDALKVSVVPSAAFTFDTNGNPLSSGTYAVGTIKIYMMVVGTTWPATLPNVVTLDLAVEQRKEKPATRYPVAIRLRDVGAGLILTPVLADFDFDDASWTDQSIVGVSVPQKIIDDPAMNADGTVLVGNLQTETTARKSRFDTVTTVKIHAMLVHPVPDLCLKTATFVTNQPLSRNLSSSSDGLDFTWGYKTAGPNTTFEYTADPSPIRDNVIIVNTCTTEQYYDAKIGLPTGFQKKSSGNVVDSSISMNANASSFPFSDPYQELKDAIAVPVPDDFPVTIGVGTALCVPNNTLAGEHSEWLSASVEVVGGFTHESEIPDESESVPGYTPFTSDLYEWDTCTTPHPSSTGQGTADVWVDSKTCTEGGNILCSAPAP